MAPIPFADSPTTTDVIDAMLPKSTMTSPVADMTDALRGRLGFVIAVIVAGALAWLIQRSRQKRHRAAWARQRYIATAASRNFALYRAAAMTPGTDVRALTPSWPDDRAPDDQPCPFPPPSAGELRPPPWATWVR